MRAMSCEVIAACRLISFHPEMANRLPYKNRECRVGCLVSQMATAIEKPKVILICGPTGIGKTSVGIQLAEELGGEIIGADSMQIYRYMDIGTAKPTVEEQARIPHHMIDIVNPDEHFDAAQYADLAHDIAMQLHNRGITPFVVGGTGLYIKALFQGLFKSEPIDPSIRNRIKKEAAEKGSVVLYARLKKIDPDTADQLHPNDTYRIVRALETIESTGKSISDHHQDHGFAGNKFDVLKICLQMDRHKLYSRIDQRVDLMVEWGFGDEVKKLLSLGYSSDLKSMQSIGYRHIIDYIERRLTWDKCLRTLKRDTRRFAKRQLTWFGADRDLNCFLPNQFTQISKLVQKFIG